MRLSLIIPLIAVLVLIVLLAVRRGGLRVTQIDRIVHRDKDSNDA